MQHLAQKHLTNVRFSVCGVHTLFHLYFFRVVAETDFFFLFVLTQLINSNRLALFCLNIFFMDRII